MQIYNKCFNIANILSIVNIILFVFTFTFDEYSKPFTNQYHTNYYIYQYNTNEMRFIYGMVCKVMFFSKG